MDVSNRRKPAGIISGSHLAGTLSASSFTNLHMTRSQVQQTNLSSGVLMFDKIVIGSTIFKISKLLLLKHAAHEIYYPNVFELRSGNIDSTDPTLAHALAREIGEEMGLKVISVGEELLPPFEYETSKVVGGAEIRKTCVQINFLVEVKDGEIKVYEEEHSVAVWADEKDVGGLEMTNGMRVLVERVCELCEIKVMNLAVQIACGIHSDNQVKTQDSSF
jgi:8-oxo-dGTP pyrophosphatase MutT (NUDIX family)